MNGLTYAYIGDAYYDLMVRLYFINKGYTNVGILHKHVSLCTSGKGQAEAIQTLLNNNHLTSDEINYYKHGRNSKVKSKRKLDIKTYIEASGFESLIGYLYLKDINRCNEIINMAINIIIKKEVSI